MIWCDLETTGFSPSVHSPIEIGLARTDDNKKVIDKIQFQCQPLDYESINKGSIKVHGISIEKMKSFPLAKDVVDDVIEWLYKGKSVEMMAGFNTQFDYNFLYMWFDRLGKNFEFFDNIMPLGKDDINLYDVQKRLVRARRKKLINIGRSTSLENACKYFGIKHGAHRALGDILSTIEVDKALDDVFDSKKAEIKQDSFLSAPIGNKDKFKKYVDSKYFIINPEGSIYISEHCSESKESMMFVLNYLREHFNKGEFYEPRNN